MTKSSSSAAANQPSRRVSLRVAGFVTAALFWLGETLLHAVAFKPHHFELLPHDDHELWMRTFICAMFVLFGFYAQSIVRRLEESEGKLAVANRELGAALERAIGDNLPVCAWCKSVRNENGKWLRLEEYLLDHSHAHVTHGICEACELKMVQDLKDHPPR